ncbi:TetR family transcriptional regulator [Paenibacillus allorhizosphaerae]|uniref:HTH-type transcriptional repressor NicS n=1 Tax=Paenibacillus allorhizosphaerae TaxID=2849866 RepID=A0ABN7TQG8_9BACL|nr:TetR family transcriptional regulator [Paenibacillus allorhizosphaerae]CAG7646183.1 HTH-type transcriptional repressor NicS [Paenibacillus allorhizosphaerae]
MAQTDSEMKIRILHAAKKLFSEQGFDGTSVRQICEEAGANVALVSYYFGGKEKVFHAVFDYFFPGRRMQQYEETLNQPVEGLRLIVKEIILFSMTDTELSGIIQQEMIRRSPRSDTIRAITFPVWEKVRELLEKGRREGVFRFESLDHTFMFIIGVALGHKKFPHFEPIMSVTESNPQWMADHAVDFIFKALEVKEQET